MPWSIYYDEKTKIIETKYDGLMSGKEVEAAAKETLDLGREKNTNLYLGDCTTLQQSKSLFDIYSLMKCLLNLKVEKNNREAIILPEFKMTAELLQFYETLALNRGFQVKIFADRETALSWLLSFKD